MYLHNIYMYLHNMSVWGRGETEHAWLSSTSGDMIREYSMTSSPSLDLGM